jgi:hypothetical protein
MKVDFFKSDCQKLTNEKKFGLYDADYKRPAKILFTDEPLWNAIVLNENRKQISFTAIDNCIPISNENGCLDEKRCDCMLTYDSTLLLIELKNKKANWQSEGLAQIENIAKIMIKEIPEYYNSFRKRKAIVANRKEKSPAFNNSNAEQRQNFYSNYKMRIQFEWEIQIQ